MANLLTTAQSSDRKRAQIQRDDAARLEKLQQMCLDLDSQNSKWRFPLLSGPANAEGTSKSDE